MHCGVDCEGPSVIKALRFASKHSSKKQLRWRVSQKRRPENSTKEAYLYYSIAQIATGRDQMVNTRRSAHIPGKQSINLARVLPKPDDTFEDQSWSQAFHNTVFSAYCPPSRKERKPPVFTVCDFQELPSEHGKPKYKRDKESVEGNDCEERVKEVLKQVLLSSQQNKTDL
jgi:hypothetical protein